MKRTQKTDTLSKVVWCAFVCGNINRISCKTFAYAHARNVCTLSDNRYQTTCALHISPRCVSAFVYLLSRCFVSVWARFLFRSYACVCFVINAFAQHICMYVQIGLGGKRDDKIFVEKYICTLIGGTRAHT